jgi:1,4-dihydroxy-2-naphthoate octaprenyltransferase
MSSETARPVVADPTPADFQGDGPQALRRLFHATRPKFYPASVLPVLAGSAWGYQVAGAFDALPFVLALLATVCVHASANVLNDVGDEQGGTDRRNTGRIYPYTGGSRFIQAGIMDISAMTRLGVGLLVVAMLAGVALIWLKGLMVLYFGLAGIALTVLYSLGPVRLASIGLGELAVAIGLGVIPVVGAAWLQSGIINTQAVLFSVPVSAWVAAILLINEVPDIEADGATGKRTLPVRLGLGGTSALYVTIHLLAVAAVVQLTATNALPIWSPLVPAALLFLVFRAASAIRVGPVERDAMTGGIEATLAVHTVGSLWLTACAIFLAIWGN